MVVAFAFLLILAPRKAAAFPNETKKFEHAMKLLNDHIRYSEGFQQLRELAAPNRDFDNKTLKWVVQYEYANALWHKEAGWVRSREEAIPYLIRAANGGFAKAEEFYGDLLSQGLIVTQNFVAAARLYESAGKHGRTRAYLKLGDLRLEFARTPHERSSTCAAYYEGWKGGDRECEERFYDRCSEFDWKTPGDTSKPEGDEQAEDDESEDSDDASDDESGGSTGDEADGEPEANGPGDDAASGSTGDETDGKPEAKGAGADAPAGGAEETANETANPPDETDGDGEGEMGTAENGEGAEDEGADTGEGEEQNGENPDSTGASDDGDSSEDGDPGADDPASSA
jgi:hypothetical protein